MAKQLIKDRKEIKRIHTGIEGFDEITEGGIPESTVTLFAGKSGTMKSSLAFNVLYNEVLHKNSNGMYISLEQSSTSLLNHMIALGFDQRLFTRKELEDKLLVRGLKVKVVRLEEMEQDLAGSRKIISKILNIYRKKYSSE